MKSRTPSQAVLNCENAIKENRDYWIEHNIYLRLIDIPNRFLERRIELLDLYEELDTKLNSNPVALHSFF